MVENLLKLKEQVQSVWGSFNKKIKIIIISAIIFVFISMLLLANWASQPAYDVLYSDLTVKDASEIINKLKEKQILYKLEKNGTTILVNGKNQVYDLRLELASEGLPNGGIVGFEIFDRNQLSNTDFEQKVDYIRAISGELTRTIQSLDHVVYARVQITPTKTSIYQDDEDPAKASVVLNLKEYTSLTNKQIEAIANLVAGSVSGLTPKKVTILDTNGNLLSARLKKETDEFDVNNKLALKIKIEEDIEKNLNVHLTKVLGLNKFSLTVNVEMNFDQRNIERKTFEPVVGNKGIVRSEKSKKEDRVGSTNTPEGVPGTTSNLPQYKVTQEKEDKYKNKEEIINYEVNEQIEKFVQDSGTVQRLSVAVTVDTSDGELSEERKKDITNLVSTAVGYDSNRGDKIAVIGYPFNKDLQDIVTRETSTMSSFIENNLAMLIGLVIGLILIIMVIFLRRRKTEDVISNKGIDYIIDEDVDDFDSIDLSPEEKDRKRLQNQLRNLTQEQPEEIASLIRSWLSDE